MVVRIRKGWVEAAARLGMWASFDKRLFDTFCVFLQVFPPFLKVSPPF
jgi:hypothetical protein